MSRFTVLVNQIEGIPEQDQLLWFKEGLNPKIRYEVRQCKTLREAITAASQYELIMGRDKTVGLNYTGRHRQFRRQFGKHQYGGKSGNSENRTGSNNNLPKKPPVCYKCHQVGHVSTKCQVRNPQTQPSKPNGSGNMASNGRNSADNSRFKPRPKTTAVCRSQADSIMSASGMINVQRVRLSLDIGAEESIISTRLAKRFGLELYTSDDQVKTATNEVCRVVGNTEAYSGPRRIRMPIVLLGTGHGGSRRVLF